MSTISFVPPEAVQGVTTSWLPITTAYPSLDGCASAFFLFPGQPFPVGWDPGYGYWAGAALSCLPPQATTWWEQDHQNPDGYTKLSIQPIVCPSAFTTAATEVRDGSSTLVKCCPSGYDLVNGQPGRAVGDCYSKLTSGQVITYTAQNFSGTYTSTSLTVSTSTQSIMGIPIEGYNVARAMSSTSTSTPTSVATPNDIKGSNGLPKAAVAGLSIGIVIAVIMTAFSVFWMCRRNRKRRLVPQQIAPSELQSAQTQGTWKGDPHLRGWYTKPAELAAK